MDADLFRLNFGVERMHKSPDMAGMVICSACDKWVQLGKVHNCTPKMRVFKKMEDHPVYAEMILRSFFELAEHAMNMSAEQLEKAWEARVRLARFAFIKAFPDDHC